MHDFFMKHFSCSHMTFVMTSQCTLNNALSLQLASLKISIYYSENNNLHNNHVYFLVIRGFHLTVKYTEKQLKMCKYEFSVDELGHSKLTENSYNNHKPFLLYTTRTNLILQKSSILTLLHFSRKTGY